MGTHYSHVTEADRMSIQAPRVRHEAPISDSKSTHHPNQINSLLREFMNFL
jgi:hypothetical protein